MITYKQLKLILQAMAPEAFNGFVSNSGSPSELILYARMTHEDIAHYQHKFSCNFLTGSITLNSTQSYDLATLFPGLTNIQSLYGDGVPGRITNYLKMAEYNYETGGPVMSLRGKKLVTKGIDSGVANIDYWTEYMVIDETTGARKQDFEHEGDYSIVPITQCLIEGILRFVDYKLRRDIRNINGILQDGRVGSVDAFQFYLQKMAADDSPIKGQLVDFRQ